MTPVLPFAMVVKMLRLILTKNLHHYIAMLFLELKFLLTVTNFATNINGA